MYFCHPTIVQKSQDVYKMIAFPNAKINIGLNILNRRKDGYHDLETVFYPIAISDALEIIESDKLLFTSSGIAIPGSPDENLCIKAYHLMRRDADLPPVRIHLHKNIPIGAGLGGGSADAAFFIRLVNDTFRLNLATERLMYYAGLLGADCSFFINNSPSFASGKGELLEPIALDLSNYFMVLVKPPVYISTAEAYRGVKPRIPEQSLKETINLPVEEWKDHINNDFELPVFKDHPGISAVKTALYEAGALYVSMSGSGSSVYGIFRRQVDLKHLEKGNQVFYGIQL